MPPDLTDPSPMEHSFESEIGEVDQYLQQLRCVKNIDRIMRTQKQVDRRSMQTLESLVPQCTDAHYPINSFTRDPTKQNLSVALESNRTAQLTLTQMSSGSLARALYFWIQIFHKSQLDDRLETLEAKRQSLLANQRVIELSQQDKQQVQQKIQETYPNHGEFVDRFIADHGVGGTIYQLVTDNGQRFETYLQSFQQRITQLNGFIDQLQQRSLPINERMIRRMRRWVVDQSEPFVKDMHRLNEHTAIYQDEQGYRSYCKTQVQPSQNFALQALLYANESFDSLTFVPYRISSIEKIIDEISDQAQLLIEKKEQVTEKGPKKGNTTNPTSNKDALEKQTKRAFDEALHDVQQSIRYEIEALRTYQNTLALLLDYYIALFNQALENQRLQQTILQQAK